MSLIINHNISALNTQRNLNNSSRAFSKSLEKLSSGYKINVAADDPSGLIISEQLRSQSNGLERAVRNSQEAANVLGIAEGALIEMNNIMRKMRSLALHAANSGVTAPDQIRADQAEVDSGIQTLDRIANTTRYSDQYLLNGSKGLVFDRATTVDEPVDHALLDIENTRLDQVFKRTGASMSISFNGTKSSTQPDWTQQARRAYFEANPSSSPDVEITQGRLTGDQAFTLTGTSGARQFRFASGTDLGSVVSAVNNVKDSTGVGATLIFDSSVQASRTTTDTTANATYVRAAGEPSFYNVNADFETTGVTGGIDAAGVAPITVAAAPTSYDALVPGKNLDGEGRMYLQWTSATDFIAYKDSGLSMEIGRGSNGVAMTESNNSGIGAAGITMSTGGATVGHISVVQFGSQFEMDDYGVDESGMSTLTTSMNFANDASSTISGVRLGQNTDENGSLYYEMSSDGTNTTVNVYKSSQMQQQDLVATGTAADAAGAQSLQVYSVAMDGGTGAQSGLYGTLTFTGAPTTGSFTGSMRFDEVGMRIYAEEYGKDEYVRLENDQGSIWGKYENPDETSLVLVEEGQTIQALGNDATITVNGQPLGTSGLTANITTPNYSGKLQFNEGVLGETTIAQVGQDVGSLYSRGTALQAVSENGTISGSAPTYPNATEAAKFSNFNFTPSAPALQQYYVRATTAGLNTTLTVYSQPGGLGGALASATVATAALPSTFTFSNNFGSVDVGSALAGAPYDIQVETTLQGELTWTTNARHSTNETLDNFIGGMQFQLGEGEGDQERTVYGIPSMAAANLGKSTIDGTNFSLQDVLAGGSSSLANDPLKALSIISQAVNDVSELRARLGAFQKNMLQTNINSLEVAVQNIIKTESAIRDTNMAAETTEFTKSQILLQAGTAMLSQANQSSQNILQLLG